LRIEPDEAFETHGESIVKLLMMAEGKGIDEFNGVVGLSDRK
jgi:hypothetical protein